MYPFFVNFGRQCLPALAFGVMLIVAGSATGQSGRAPVPATEPGTPVGQDDVIRVRTDEIMVPVSVRNSEGKRVEGLTPEDFMIFDTGKRQEIAGFNRERTPVNVLLLLDASGSVFEHMKFIREAAVRFAGELRPVDKVCVLQFADDVELLQDWTSPENSSAISKALNWRYHPGENTNFYDGIYLAAKDRMAKVTGRKIIILLTDGIDSPKVKHASREDSINALKLSEAALYVISLTAILRRSVDQQAGTTKTARALSGISGRVVRQVHQMIDQAEDSLDQMSRSTGGDMFLPLEDDDLGVAMQAISEELRSQYIITYRPSPAAKAGEWRNIKVLVKNGGYDIQARDGYRGRD